MEEKYYVYELAYPDGTPFYYGKGTANRIDMHEMEARLDLAYSNQRKIEVIHKIWENGEQIKKRKVAFFDEEQDAYMYEWALTYMSCIAPTLTNALVNRGSQSAREPKVRCLAKDGAKKLVIIRQEAGFKTQRELARVAGINKSMMWRAEHPEFKRPIGLKVAYRILNALRTRGFDLSIHDIDWNVNVKEVQNAG